MAGTVCFHRKYVCDVVHCDDCTILVESLAGALFVHGPVMIREFAEIVVKNIRSYSYAGCLRR